MQNSSSKKNTFHQTPFMGVAHVVNKATELGYRMDHPEWCNFGVGQPEVGELDGAPERCKQIEVAIADNEYGPSNGIDSLRDAIAEHYNRLFRTDKCSKYTKDNVSIANGGRLMLTRLFSALNDINLGYQTPDYTAYEEILSPHRSRFNPILLRANEQDHFKVPSSTIEQHIKNEHLGAFLISNPCNPTGQVIQGNELNNLIKIGQQQSCTFIFDEFYSHYIYTDENQPAEKGISAAEHIDDVNADSVIIIDGLTKNFRYPGWRLSWALGPKDVIDNLGRATGGIDGSPSVPIQNAAIDILSPTNADRETNAIRRVFADKRVLMLNRLRKMNIEPTDGSQGTFYLWANISKLPAPFNDAETFSDECLKHKIITIPGPCFDVNPGRTREGEPAYKNWVRFSFGPAKEQLEMGLNRLETMLNT